MGDLRFRQVHLDFHTSEYLTDIGKKFDKLQFQQTLQMGHVNSITLFSKCHHGWSYHPTTVNQMHPHLTIDLLQEQMLACREIDVRTPVYLSAGLDEKEAVRHPEWVARQADETTTWVKDFTSEAGFHLLCFNTGYLDLLLRQIEEVMRVYHPPGIFLDIAAVHPCYCSKCRREILERGKDPRDMEAVMEQAEKVYASYTDKVEQMIRKYSSSCTIFHNAGHITRGRRDLAACNTHLELESLPTGGWGYDHFPMSAAYVSNLSMEYLGMTGKFHNTWGEFGGFKHPNALRYETSLSLAFGAKCSIGDQLHPSGCLDHDTYELIGRAYREVEKKEPWCRDAKNCYDIGVLGEEAVHTKISDRNQKRYADIGANRILLEGKFLYRFLDLQSDFSRCKVLILPDRIQPDEKLQRRLQEYLRDGGKILASGRSGTEPSSDRFVLDFGAEFRGPISFRPDYLIPAFPLSTGQSPHAMYEQGYEIVMKNGKQMGSREYPYFNRDVFHFSSHQHTPNDPDQKWPSISMTERTAYIGWDIFTDYAKMGSLHLKETVIYLLDCLLGDRKMIQASLPDRGVCTLTWQKKEQRFITHLLFAHTSVRGQFLWDGELHPIEVIESIV
ncbi:MAG TPA: hypothetical protein PLU43_06695, partial [Lachnospiraceae bacterium]|nr:hypothetical protein [Lachnospiraceae bacterium]